MEAKEHTYHTPVLLKESLEGLNLRKDGIFVDVTFGGGGHSKAIISHLHEDGHLYGFDQDVDAEKNIVNDARFTFIRSNFRYLKNWMQYYHVDKIDGLLADLGVSSHHFDDHTRGFSFRFDGILDMRMNQMTIKTAADIVNTYEEGKLANLFYLYGELKNSRKIAAALVRGRGKKSIITIEDFLSIIRPFFRKDNEKKELAKIFQALRIEVNQEMDALKEMLCSSIELLKPGGRLAIISYQSLEDRIVKNIMKTGNTEGSLKQDFFGNILSPLITINNKVITPCAEEIENNPRSRSAKLRIAEKK